MAVSMSSLILPLSSADKNIHIKVFLCRKNNKKALRVFQVVGVLSGACLRSVINPHQQPHNISEITNG